MKNVLALLVLMETCILRDSLVGQALATQAWGPTLKS